jgi:hypothetical protein
MRFEEGGRGHLGKSLAPGPKENHGQKRHAEEKDHDTEA